MSWLWTMLSKCIFKSFTCFATLLIAAHWEWNWRKGKLHVARAPVSTGEVKAINQSATEEEKVSRMM